MKPIVPVLALLSLPAVASGQLVITEVMASSGHANTKANGDWWELTNTGTTAVSLNNYKWDDKPTPDLPTVSTFPSGVSIQPGESIVILDEDAENLATWRAAWGLSASTRVLTKDQFSGTDFSGLSGDSDDEVNLYNAGGSVVASVAFGASSSGRSFAYHPDGMPVIGASSRVNREGAFGSSLSPADVGSPGNTRLHFTSSPVRYGKGTYHYAISAVRPGAAAATFSASGLPPFLTLTAGSGGKATLANNRPLTLADTGEYLVEITASSGGADTVQEFVVSILNPLPSIVLNEYNAVAAENFLNGGTATTDDDGGPLSTDTHFGRVAGNGGSWAEFVVVGEGTVDMRGWTLEIGSNPGTGFSSRNRIVLSNHSNWAAVPQGTILTFISRNTAQGGLNSAFGIRDNRATTGEIWSNVWVGDPDYFVYTNLPTNGYQLLGGTVSGVYTDHNNTQFRVKNGSGQVVFGPVGEGVGRLSGLNSREVFKLKDHPTVLVSPFDIATANTRGYDDGASGSTFGWPNTWTEGTATVTQLFNLIPPAEIAVEQPVGTVIKDGGSVTYGSVAVGANSSRTFTIRNLGISELTGLVITKTGSHAADFTVTASPVAPVAGPLGTTTFTVRFAPSASGTRKAAIRIASNDEDEASYDINLSGTAFVRAPEIGIQQPAGSELVDGKSKKSFGTVKVGKKSASKTFTIRNTGTANLTGIALAIKGKHAKDFVATKPGKTTLAPGASTTFKVTFKPTATGTRTGAIQLKSNDANENPFDITLTGAGAKK